jgi:hypothetical protein
MSAPQLTLVGSEGGAAGPALPGSGSVTEQEWITEARLLKVAGDALDRKTEEWKYAVGDWWNRGTWGSDARKRGPRELGVHPSTVMTWATASRNIPDLDRSRIGTSAAKEISAVPQEHRERYMTMAREGAGKNELQRARVKEFGVKPKNTPAAKPKADTADREKRRAKAAEVKASKDRTHEIAYNTMKTAPAGAQNNPLFWRASKVEALINELRNRTPEEAVSMLVSPAPRFFTEQNLEWWTKFVALCVERVRAEGLRPLADREPSQALWAESGLDVRGAGG